MPTLTIGRMAKLYGLHRSTLYEAVEKGRVSAGLNEKGERVLDLSEMIRAYGEPLGQPDRPDTNPTPSPDTSPDSAPTLAPDTLALLDELRGMREELAALRREVAELRRLPAPGQLVPHPDDRPRHDEASAAEGPEEGTAPRERHGNESPARSFTDLLDKLNARVGG